jgi:hypothetical protein
MLFAPFISISVDGSTGGNSSDSGCHCLLIQRRAVHTGTKPYSDLTLLSGRGVRSLEGSGRRSQGRSIDHKHSRGLLFAGPRKYRPSSNQRRLIFRDKKGSALLLVSRCHIGCCLIVIGSVARLTFATHDIEHRFRTTHYCCNFPLSSCHQ